MKKLILFLLLTTISFSQSADFLLLMNDGGYKNAETRVYLASLTTPISKTYAATLDSFITKVKDSLSITSLSQKIDVMYDLGGYNQEQSLKNLVKRSHDATAVNSPTFTQWEGFTGDGSTSYLNMNYNPSTQASAITLNKTSFGIYVRNTQNAEVSTGGNDGTQGLQIPLDGISNTRNYLVNNVFAPITGAVNVAVAGMNVVGRVLSTHKFYFRNSTLVTDANNSSALPNVSLYLLCRNGNGTAGLFNTIQHGFAFVGGVTTAEILKLSNCIEWLMDRKGTGVIP